MAENPLQGEPHPAPLHLPPLERPRLRIITRAQYHGTVVAVFLAGAALGSFGMALHLNEQNRQRCADVRVQGWGDGYADGWLDGTREVDAVLRKVEELERQEHKRREREKHFALRGL